MQFNKIIRGADKSANYKESVYQILDAGFLCHIAFQHEGQSMMIPTAYGRKDDMLYIHGSTKNYMLNQIIHGESVCIGVTLLDGIVLARTLFDTSANYRSVVLFGKAELVTANDERLEGLKVITENIIKGRWDEVSVGSPNQLKATMVVKFKIDKASAKIRDGGPKGDEENVQEVWSGHIPLSIKASEPVMDTKFGVELTITKSVMDFWEKYN
ncbi:MAG TPA: pyridoxamine 5'-phosphate oxidase family protein [Chitinophagaceae bacterium]|nr:pyridoxamine 5'-phosphate oxidase family protein [Chitinophagaceae bacterium]